MIACAPPTVTESLTRDQLLEIDYYLRLTRTLVKQQAWGRYRKTELTPGVDVVSDTDIEAFLRRKTGTSYHPAGT